jgi:hypothetical protein
MDTQNNIYQITQNNPLIHSLIKGANMNKHKLKPIKIRFSKAEEARREAVELERDEIFSTFDAAIREVIFESKLPVRYRGFILRTFTSTIKEVRLLDESLAYMKNTEENTRALYDAALGVLLEVNERVESKQPFIREEI